MKLTPTQQKIAQFIYDRVLSQTGNPNEAADIVGMAYQESKFKPTAIGPNTGKGRGRAKGILQFLDSTAARYGINNPYDIGQQVDATIKYRQDIRKHLANKGVPITRENVIAAHNAGEGAVAKYKSIPPYRQTQNYVREILARQEALLSGIRQRPFNAAALPATPPVSQYGRPQPEYGGQSGRSYASQTVAQESQGAAKAQNRVTSLGQGSGFLPPDYQMLAPAGGSSPLSLPPLTIDSILNQPIPAQTFNLSPQAQALLGATAFQPVQPLVTSSDVYLEAAQAFGVDTTPEESRRTASRLITGALINGPRSSR